MTHIEEDTSKTYCANEKKTSALQQRMKQRERQNLRRFFFVVSVSCYEELIGTPKPHAVSMAKL